MILLGRLLRRLPRRESAIIIIVLIRRAGPALLALRAAVILVVRAFPFIDPRADLSPLDILAPSITLMNRQTPKLPLRSSTKHPITLTILLTTSILPPNPSKTRHRRPSTVQSSKEPRIPPPPPRRLIIKLTRNANPLEVIEFPTPLPPHPELLLHFPSPLRASSLFPLVAQRSEGLPERRHGVCQRGGVVEFKVWRL